MFEVLSSFTWIWTIILDSTWLSHLILRLRKWPEIKCRAGQHWSWAGCFLLPGSSLVPGCGHLFYQLPLPSFFLHLSREWEHWPEFEPARAPDLQVAGQGQALPWDPKPENCPRSVITFRKGPGLFFCWNPLMTVLHPDCDSRHWLCGRYLTLILQDETTGVKGTWDLSILFLTVASRSTIISKQKG